MSQKSQSRTFRQLYQQYCLQSRITNTALSLGRCRLRDRCDQHLRFEVIAAAIYLMRCELCIIIIFIIIIIIIIRAYY